MQMKNFKAEGIVIKRRNVGEADRIITVFTKQHGKLQIKATGVRKITSRRSPHIELLNYSALTLYSGRSYPVLVEAQAKDTFANIKEDLTKVGLAYHMCELVDGLCPEGEAHEAVFHVLHDSLMKLMEKENDALRLVHEFEVTLLKLLGFWQGSPEIAAKLDTIAFIENIMERRLKSRNVFAKLHEEY